MTRPDPFHAFTDDELVAGIAKAIEAHDFPAVAGILQMLAVQAPAKAQEIYDAIVHRRATVTIDFDAIGD